MTGILEHLKWESLKKRRRDSRLILLYKGLKDKASIPKITLSPWLGVAGMIILWHIRFPLLTLIFYKCSFSPRPLGVGMHFQTLLSPPAEGAEDGVAKSTFLVRARELSSWSWSR